MKAMKQGSLVEIQGLSWLFHQILIVWNHENMIKSFIKDVTKLNDFLDDSKGFRRVFARYDKLDVMYLAFVVFA